MRKLTDRYVCTAAGHSNPRTIRYGEKYFVQFTARGLFGVTIRFSCSASRIFTSTRDTCSPIQSHQYLCPGYIGPSQGSSQTSPCNNPRRSESTLIVHPLEKDTEWGVGGGGRASAREACQQWSYVSETTSIDKFPTLALWPNWRFRRSPRREPLPYSTLRIESPNVVRKRYGGETFEQAPPRAWDRA